MNISRRLFLRGLVSVPILVGAPALLEARTLQREPYVAVGMQVDSISLNMHPSPTFTGSARVEEVGGWNGEFYPVVVNQGWKPLMFPDHDLCVFLDDVPSRFWHHHSSDEWPNVHAWVRHKRFGEHPSVMRSRVEAARLGLPWPSQG